MWRLARPKQLMFTTSSSREAVQIFSLSARMLFGLPPLAFWFLRYCRYFFFGFFFSGNLQIIMIVAVFICYPGMMIFQIWLFWTSCKLIIFRSSSFLHRLATLNVNLLCHWSMSGLFHFLEVWLPDFGSRMKCQEWVKCAAVFSKIGNEEELVLGV